MDNLKKTVFALLAPIFILFRKQFKSKQKKYVFIAPVFSNSGAPVVLLDLIFDFVEKFSANNIVLVTPFINEQYSKVLNDKGITVLVVDTNASYVYLDYRLNLHPSDYVLVNTVAIPPVWRDWLICKTEKGELNKFYWYIHEDLPEIQFKDQQLKKRTYDLLAKGKLGILAPGKKIAENYQKYFNFDITYAPYRFNLSDLPTAINSPELTEESFEKINFAINGSVYEGRKGQLLILFAFILFEERFKSRDKSLYRDYTLNFIGVSDSFIVKQIETLCHQYFQENSIIHGNLDRQSVLEILTKTNCNICYSFMEALPVNVFESMWFGHFILRNDSSGIDEQLIPGTNGFYLDSENIEKFVETIEQVLNKETTKNSDLWQMGQSSKEILKKYQDVNYLQYFY